MALEVNRPEDAATAFADAWNRHDIDDFAALFSEDANFVNVVGMWWKNRAEIEAAHRATHETMFRDSRLQGVVSPVVELSPGVASVHYRWTLTGASAPDGSPAGTREGILLLVVKKEQSGWRIKVAKTPTLFQGRSLPLPRPDSCIAAVRSRWPGEARRTSIPGPGLSFERARQPHALRGGHN
ncbi:SgcJ/EcaC family oxidoreductase [Mesorhizobium sp. CA8]|uniref:YybH family protein n=1 Tax=Mesorhizobium sp. CA8 TaxID=2876637 RepID=UPI001CCA9404|nr:SgcJ/EcaC family oxidoreductase [Mesorhizobium sp. CA8]MBZ9761497.1 SgcJ/EcaC family oxidoreductase [Mesorhizobium sp. CA8]